MAILSCLIATLVVFLRRNYKDASAILPPSDLPMAKDTSNMVVNPTFVPTKDRAESGQPVDNCPTNKRADRGKPITHASSFASNHRDEFCAPLYVQSPQRNDSGCTSGSGLPSMPSQDTYDTVEDDTFVTVVTRADQGQNNTVVRDATFDASGNEYWAITTAGPGVSEYVAHATASTTTAPDGYAVPHGAGRIPARGSKNVYQTLSTSTTTSVDASITYAIPVGDTEPMGGNVYQSLDTASHAPHPPQTHTTMYATLTQTDNATMVSIGYNHHTLDDLSALPQSTST